MPVYVDGMAVCIPNQNWPHRESCHLFADPGDEAELHRIAARIGLRRSWFQNRGRGSLPHYDLTESKRQAAIAAGAIDGDRSDTMRVLRAYWAAEAAEKGEGG